MNKAQKNLLRYKCIIARGKIEWSYYVFELFNMVTRHNLVLSFQELINTIGNGIVTICAVWSVSTFIRMPLASHPPAICESRFAICLYLVFLLTKNFDERNKNLIIITRYKSPFANQYQPKIGWNYWMHSRLVSWLLFYHATMLTRGYMVLEECNLVNIHHEIWIHTMDHATDNAATTLNVYL